ncbi:hypothetical protein [Shewanella waksmanii]
MRIAQIRQSSLIEPHSATNEGHCAGTRRDLGVARYDDSHASEQGD